MMHDTILHGDALALLRGLPDNSIDALCCDPPAGIGFMGVDWDSYGEGKGKERSDDSWDWQGSKERPRTAQAQQRVTAKQGRLFREAMEPVFAECLRVVKPGGHALVWALPRTSHWTATALEDAGWEIRDNISHVLHIFGQGFPKSKNLGNGVGSALKPAVEFWILARKPLACANLASNVLAWGTGGINVDGCRVGNDSTLRPMGKNALGIMNDDGWKSKPTIGGSQAGRWPPNLLLSHSPHCTPHACCEECPIALLDEQAGISGSGSGKVKVSGGKGFCKDKFMGAIGKGEGTYVEGIRDFGDAGGVSRFFPVFYAAKASRRERNEGCEALPEQSAGAYGDFAGGMIGAYPERGNRQSEHRPASNNHPTVKPLALMRWLVRLITPPGGTVLDCFAGSGSTLVACVQEGLHFIGMEQDASYIEIARARIAHAHQEAQQTPLPRKPISLATRRKKRATNPDIEQMTLFA